MFVQSTGDKEPEKKIHTPTHAHTNTQLPFWKETFVY